jgi:hypothetical protein
VGVEDADWIRQWRDGGWVAFSFKSYEHLKLGSASGGAQRFAEAR